MRTLRTPRVLLAAALVLCVGLPACGAGSGSGDGDGGGGDATAGGSDDGARMNDAATRLALFEGGERNAVPPTSEKTDKVLEYLYHCIEKREMVLRVAPATESMDEIKAAERCLEVEIAEPRELTAGNSGRVLTPNRLLVPLTGKYAAKGEADNLTIFAGDPEYSPLPLIVRTGRKDLLALLDANGAY